MDVLLFLVVFLGGWVGLAKYWMRKGNSKALSIIGAGLLSFFVGGMLGAAVDRPSQSAQPKVAEKVAVVEAVPQNLTTQPAPVSRQPLPKQSEEPSLGLSLDEYTKRFDFVSKKLKSRYRLHAMQKMDDSLGVVRFTSTLSDRLTVSGVLADNGEISSVNLIASQTNDDEHAIDQMAMTVATLTAASKGSTTEELGPTLGEILGEAAAHMKLGDDHFSVEHAYNGVNFRMARLEGVNMYTAQPADG